MRLKFILAIFLFFTGGIFFGAKTVLADTCYNGGGNCGTSCSSCTTCYDANWTYYSYCNDPPPPPPPPPSSCVTNYWSCQNECGNWGGMYCDSCGSCGACDAPSCYVPPPPPPPEPTPTPTSLQTLTGPNSSCQQYFSCTDVRCADGSIAPGTGCYSPDTYVSDCTNNCVVTGAGAPTPTPSTGGTSGACPDECYSDDLRTNVQRDPATGLCSSSYSSTSHLCTTQGTTGTCNGGSYTCTRQTSGLRWVPSGNAGNNGYTNTWVCDSSGGFYTCQGGTQTFCCTTCGDGEQPSPPPGGGGPPPPPYVSPPPPPISAWWQVKDADIASAGDIRSSIPSTCTGGCIPQLSLSGLGGFPGVPAYSGSSNLGSGSVSANGWAANTSYAGRRYDYDWYSSLAPGDTEKIDCSGGCTLSGGDIVSKAATDKANLVIYDGNVTINSTVNLNNKKIAIFVNGTLNINGQIKLDRGSGFYMAITKGSIIVDPSVSGGGNPALEGLFVSDGQFLTGSGNQRLYVRGSVVAWSGIVLQRDLGSSSNETQAAETFEYAPDLVLNFPKQLFREGIVWKEVAP